MTSIQLEREQVSCLARMLGSPILRVLGLGEEARPSPSPAGRWRLGRLALQFEERGWLALTVRSMDIRAEGSGEVELFLPAVQAEAELPSVSQWPGGPAAAWSPLPALEEMLAGSLLNDVKILSRNVEVRDLASGRVSSTFLLDAALRLDLSGERSLLVEASEELPMALDLSVDRSGVSGRFGRERSVMAPDLELLK